jgi:hypothetical protein
MKNRSKFKEKIKNFMRLKIAQSPPDHPKIASFKKIKRGI